MRKLTHVVLAVLFLGLGGCAGVQASRSGSMKPQVPRTNSDGYHATLWVSSSAEYDASCYQTYNTALAMAKQALEDPSWSAVANDQVENDQSLPLAIVMDGDETTLRSTPYQAKLVLDGTRFNVQDFAKWLKTQPTTAVPGAARFTQEAAKLGIHVFYHTNRDKNDAEGTLRELKKLGFALTDGQDSIVTGKVYANKAETRKELAKKYRIILLVGDDAVDFFTGFHMKDAPARKKIAQRYKSWWGTRWFILPNPIYGSWERAIVGHNPSLSIEKKIQIKRALLKEIAADR